MAKYGRTTFFWHTEAPSDGPRESYAKDSTHFTHPVNVVPGSLEGRAQAAADLIGYQLVEAPGAAQQLNGVNVRFISRAVPLAYPLPTQLPPTMTATLATAYCTGLLTGHGLGAGFMGPSGATDFPQYQFDAQFDALPYDVLYDAQVLAQNNAGPDKSPLFDTTTGAAAPDEGDCLRRGYVNTRYIARLLKFGGRKITTRSNYYHYDTADSAGGFNAVPWPITIDQALTDVMYVWYLVPQNGVPAKAIISSVSCVNNDTFDGFGPGNLMLGGVDIKRVRSPLGPWLAEVQYRCRFLPNVRFTGGTTTGWNSALRYDSNNTLDWDTISVQGNNVGNRPYRAVPFSALFRPDQT